MSKAKCVTHFTGCACQEEELQSLRARIAELEAEKARAYDKHDLDWKTVAAEYEPDFENPTRVVLKMSKEIASLRAHVADLGLQLKLAIAHDRQPYPTVEAYELACKARDIARARVAELTAILEACLYTGSMTSPQLDELENKINEALQKSSDGSELLGAVMEAIKVMSGLNFRSCCNRDFGTNAATAALRKALGEEG